MFSLLGSCSGSVRVQVRVQVRVKVRGGVFRRACCGRPAYSPPPPTSHLPPTTYRHRRMHSQFSLVRVMISTALRGALRMELNNRTVVVTGGASGIGLAIAARFYRAGSTVIVCGRREDTLREVQAASPGLVTHVANLATAPERVAFRDWVVRQYPSVDVLVNNAGIQRRISLADDE